jgi:hypothetical protein
MPGQVSVMFFTGTSNSSYSGKAVSAFRPTQVEAASSDSTTYILSGSVDTIPSESMWRIEVVANVLDFDYNVLPLGTTSNFASDTILVQHSTFNWPAGTVPAWSTPIPMYGHYGKTQCQLPLNQPIGYYYDLTDYAPNLIRGVAKIVIRSNEEIKSPKLSRCNTVGMIYPKNGYCANGAFSEITDGNMNIPSETTGKYDNGVTTDAPFSVLKDGATKTKKYKYNYVIYVPEYRNVATTIKDGLREVTIPADVEPVISLNFNGQDKSFKFGTYEDGVYTGACNILRNYIYEYILSTSPIPIKYSVRPWDEKEAGEITFN